MKKKVAIFTSALLSATVLLSATACKGNASKLLPEVERSQGTTKVTALTKDHSLSTFDELGLCVVTTVNTEQNSTTYQLFDAVANNFVAGSSVTVNAPQAPATDALSHSVQAGLQAKTTGMYYTSKTTYTRTATTDDWATAETKTEYTIYGRNGKIAENIEGGFEDDTFITKQGARIYVDVNGNIATESNLLKNYLTYTMYMRAVRELDDYYVDSSVGNGMYIVYDEKGQYLRTFNSEVALDIPETADLNATWSVGNRFFFQYSNQLPEDEDDYDYLAYSGASGNVQKYDLITAYYNVKKDKVKEIDFDYVVQGTSVAPTARDRIILEVQEIKDEQLMDNVVIQSFDDDGDVAIDLQELVKGATSFRPINEESVIISDGMTNYLYQRRKLVNEYLFDTNTTARPVGECFYTVDQSNELVNIYNLDGSHFKTYENTTIVNSYNADLILQTETSIIRFNTETKTEKLVCSFEKGTAESGPAGSSLYIEVKQYGADKLPNTADDTHSIYFLIPDMEDMVNLSVDARSKISISSSISYDTHNKEYGITGNLFYIERDTDTGATREYYNTYNRYDYE